MSELKIDSIDSPACGVKFQVTMELLEEMAHCINDCSWVSGEEIAAYMKSCVTDGDYEPEDWSVDGKGEMAVERNIIDINDGEL